MRTHGPVSLKWIFSGSVVNRSFGQSVGHQWIGLVSNSMTSILSFIPELPMPLVMLIQWLLISHL